MKKLRAILRGVGLVLGTLYHLLPLLLISAIKGYDLSRALRVRKRWASLMMRILGLQIEMKGQPYEAPAVYISNHRSYMDPIISLRDIKALPVAKAEIEKWPLVGFAAKSTGIMYVKRESNSSRKATLTAMIETLNLGFQVLIYPEGTTELHPTSRDFKRGAFKLAANNGYPIVPMAIEYQYDEDAWVGELSFIEHFLDRFGQKHMKVKVSYGSIIESDDAEFLHDEAKAWIDKEMLEMRKGFNERA